MIIWVDADACPVVIRDILCRAAERTATAVRFVSNHAITLPGSRHIRAVQVEAGFDMADKLIAERVSPGDLVITNDIPLADEVITKGALALSPRGELFTRDNIRARLNMRDFMETLRSSGIQSGGSAPMNQSDRQAFANALDRELARARGAAQASQQQ